MRTPIIDSFMEHGYSINPIKKDGDLHFDLSKGEEIAYRSSGLTKTLNEVLEEMEESLADWLVSDYIKSNSNQSPE